MNEEPKMIKIVPIFDIDEELNIDRLKEELILNEEIDPKIIEKDLAEYIFHPEKFKDAIPIIKIVGVTFIDKDNYNNLDTFNNGKWNSGKYGHHIGIQKNKWFACYLKTFYTDFDNDYDYAIKITKEDARKEIIRTENQDLFNLDEFKRLI
jgi:hypothetical protein